MSMTTFVVIWAFLGIATLSLAAYRKLISAHEADLVHLGPGEEHEIPEQLALASKLAVVDRWGKMLTVMTVLAGLALAVSYLYVAWQNPSAAPNYFWHQPFVR